MTDRLTKRLIFSHHPHIIRQRQFTLLSSPAWLKFIRPTHWMYMYINPLIYATFTGFSHEMQTYRLPAECINIQWILIWAAIWKIYIYEWMASYMGKAYMTFKSNHRMVNFFTKYTPHRLIYIQLLSLCVGHNTYYNMINFLHNSHNRYFIACHS